MSWFPFDNGKTIDSKGSEGGTILFDEEHLNGARVSLEENCYNAPYAITIGIYGVMFHTDFQDNLKASKLKYELLKHKIELVLNHLAIDEEKRKEDWNILFNNMLDDLLN
ncbi:hypothetical protein [Winogradskyella marincola]|uniref:Uncharacterized protein n=1 Tax=Winogradskyella marincola TaxID=3037795 RepID=A0ABT6FXQ2_9FLAO|nr:hypothetical protein [Winogradskyella sp. YYF002]MDG4714556.1 hypothetical protein [Winogradskyella sp. YYF002]